jgi:3-hydroxymyristoyl/3-hydroxydecanoyl-(acyl carrier protein) dehydratase
MPVILATQQIEIRRIAVPNQPGQIVRETLSQKKKKITKNRVDEVAQGEALSSSTSTAKNE